MENNSNRANILLVLQVLEEYSDQDHYLTQVEIAQLVEKKFGVSMERKSVGRAMQMLEELDYDIVKGKHCGFALLSRDFDESQARFLIDAVFSSKSISSKLAKQLIESIYGSLSVYQRKTYDQLLKSNNVSRTQNNDVFYNIEIIQEAIKQKKWIEYHYLTHDKEGHLIPRMDGYLYHASPCYLISNNGYYYLLAFRRGRDVVLTWRVDYMRDIRIMDDRVMIDPRTLPEFSGYKSITEYMNDHIYLFGGKVIEARLQLKGEYAISYIKDWFGENATLEADDERIIYRLRCDENALYYWCMQYGDHITVLEPESLRNRIKESALAMVSKYQAQ